LAGNSFDAQQVARFKGAATPSGRPVAGSGAL